ncbi:hypothetical protein KSP39_PZI010685 [Platanthera zijinensis]|uniref:Jacalin-type lectin domain-containing protein n=1 Tax=Platanthera zijinensis TaxID=2320716 RepID=A0AAP0BLR8_9ASPA
MESAKAAKSPDRNLAARTSRYSNAEETLSAICKLPNCKVAEPPDYPRTAAAVLNRPPEANNFIELGKISKKKTAWSCRARRIEKQSVLTARTRGLSTTGLGTKPDQDYTTKSPQRGLQTGELKNQSAQPGELRDYTKASPRHNPLPNSRAPKESGTCQTRRTPDESALLQIPNLSARLHPGNKHTAGPLADLDSRQPCPPLLSAQPARTINPKRPLTWVSGYYGLYANEPENAPHRYYKVITSLKFGNEEEAYGPFGFPDGACFSFCPGAEIAGFHGSSYDPTTVGFGYISAIGIYVKTEAVGFLGETSASSIASEAVV